MRKVIGIKMPIFVALLFLIKITNNKLLMPDVQNINLSKMIKLLELIKSLIALEEEDKLTLTSVIST